MWVKTTCCYHLYLLLTIRKYVYNIVLVQTHTNKQASTCTVQKVVTFSHSLASTGRDLQSPSSCTSQYAYQHVGVDLQKATTFFLPLGTTFHKFSNWMLLVCNNTHEGLVSSNFHTGHIINIEAQNQSPLHYNHQIHLHHQSLKLKHHFLNQSNLINH